MTWLSINPDSEPYTRKSNAVALSAKPGVRDKMFSMVVTDAIDPIYLARCYNNAENLGLDLLSLESKQPAETAKTALFEEHENFFSELAEAAFRDIEREDSGWTLTKDLLWSYNILTKTYYDE